jgi:hypothetical protein
MKKVGIVRTFIASVLPGVLKPLRVLWNEIIAFFFFVMAVIAVPSTYRAIRDFNGRTRCPGAHSPHRHVRACDGRVRPVFDAARAEDRQVVSERPGEFPFTRGIYPDMYRSRLWTMRQYAGFGSADESNRRYRYLLSQGITGLSVAFDLPTQMGMDSDHSLARGEVGRVGVAICSLADMERLFEGIRLEEVTTSMTINSTAAILLAFYVLVARRQGADLSKLSGTIQNDILKEYIARGHLHLPAAPGDANYHRRVRLDRARTAAVEQHFDLRLSHSRGGLDGGAGDCVHPGQRHRLHRGGAGGRTCD